jgi:hypothetical protein
MEVVNALNKDGLCWYKYGSMVNETKFLLNSILDWKVGHIKRSGNVAAHKLAKYGLSITGDHLWRDAYMVARKKNAVLEVWD